MKVIELYIMRRTFALFAAALLWVLALVWTTQVLNRIDLVTDSGQSAGTFFLVAALVLPAVIPVVIPFALGIAVAQTLATMNTDSELAVINASGAPRGTIIRPILIIALGASIASFLINNTLEPASRQAFRSILANARADLITTVLQEGSFQKVGDGLFVQISERLPNGLLGGIFVADSRDEKTKLVYHARTGATVERDGGSILVMQDGMIQRESANGDVSTIRFDSYAFDLSEFTSTGGGMPTLHPKDRSLGFLLSPDPNDDFYKRSPQVFRAELHMRFSEWLYPLVFAMIGLAVAGDARSFREARLHPMVTTMVIALLVRWIGFYSGTEAETSSVFSFVLYAAPILMIGICAFFIATNRVMELPTHWVEKLTARMQSLTDMMTRLRIRLARMRSPAGGRG
ncbi:LPS export ABC transporter permease LptF [Nitratireductor sp. ZSWI3]|uniref:LPS export ABC transporter permease LptF n=1 Tax=Nitratireductor sp. ZSWI3 TaxID=2966359 RepID=UPI00215061CF|nr:LPS export ABC transporter permease LptF [Nitratireductor sp. ZSWI3]MCR4269196.1 LPS export ABC transporter permease LptF [Nitratireductor sp. ZSWI3]